MTEPPIWFRVGRVPPIDGRAAVPVGGAMPIKASNDAPVDALTDQPFIRVERDPGGDVPGRV